MTDLPDDNRRRINELERSHASLQARFDTELNAMKSMLTEVRNDTREVRDTIINAKGGWKTLVVVGSIAGTIGALFGKLASIVNLPS